MATVRNTGSTAAPPSSLRYYRSSNSAISESDTQVGSDSVSALSVGASGNESLTITAPSSAGTYYYGACVVGVSGESNTGNNCSSGVGVTVTATSAGGGNSGGDNHGDSVSAASTIALNSITAASINPVGDNDYFRIEITESGTLVLYTEGDTDTYGYLL